ncbi:Flagellar biosynthetic protein FliO [Chitinispirillum alkaliphilum]|nr:Flagellar biosynthetic protein FliO [Chitinispirillum alkaliphilum]
MKTMKKNRWFSKALILTFLWGAVLVFTAAAQAREDDIGKFQIDKVNEAVSGMGEIDYGDEQAGVAQSRQNDNYALVILRIIGYLAIIIALIFLVAWFLKKTGLSGASKVGGGGNMDVLEVLSFGQNRNAMLVRVMDCVYLLGQTPDSIVLLEKIEGQRAIDLIASSKEGTSIVQFKDAFNSFIGKITKSS